MDELYRLLACSNEQLAQADPVLLNLVVARGIPDLADLDVRRYQDQVDAWAAQARRWIAANEPAFGETPQDWKHDIRFFRLCMLWGYIHKYLGLAYIEEQREVRSILYTDPTDLFLNGVMDSRRGTCANMAVLYIAFAWRLGWPVSLACVGSHYFARFDDGKVHYNINASNIGLGGVSAPEDVWMIEHFGSSHRAVACGSDLRSLTPRETLGAFVGLRARHWMDTRRLALADQDYCLARHLYPLSRRFHRSGVEAALLFGGGLFDPDEKGHPANQAAEAIRCYSRPPGMRPMNAPPWLPPGHSMAVDLLLSQNAMLQAIGMTGITKVVNAGFSPPPPKGT